MAKRSDAELIASLAGEADGDAIPVRDEDLVLDIDWNPDLNPTQRLAYDDWTSRFIMMYGERGSGKSVGGVHKLVKHCVLNFNALAIIIVGVKRQATEGGVWSELETQILPMWKERAGLVYSNTSTNTAKDSFIFVRNRFNGWSKILLLSMPVGSFIKDRVKGLAPSFILLDEGQTLDGPDYFDVVIQQLGRRANISTVQQYVLTCNPDGPSHWLYDRFFVKPLNAETGEWNPVYAKYHIPIVENLRNLPAGYYEHNVIEAVKDDPVEYRRMVLGEWVDRPSGEAIFRNSYSPQLHVRGSIKDGTRLLPKTGFPLTLGYDLGTANSAISFLQNIPTKDKDLWIVFDEMCYTDAYISYPMLVPEIVRRLEYWNNVVGTEFAVEHISDSTAFNVFRATDGTYDVLEVERISRDAIKYFPKVKPIKMIQCPKFQGSVAGRVKTTMKFLQQERLLISDTCVKTKEMFMRLESEKMDHSKKYSPELPFSPRRSKHLHIFDAMSYALFYNDLGTKFSSPTKSDMFFMGRG